MNKMIQCRDCKVEFAAPVQRGRPPVRCPECKAKFIAISGSGSVQSLPVPQPIPKTITQRDNMPQLNNTAQAMIEIVREVTEVTESVSIPTVPRDTIEDSGFLYSVMVTNMGWAYRGDDKKEAQNHYNDFVKKSTAGFGQVGNETVRLFCRVDGQASLIQEFKP